MPAGGGVIVPHNAMSQRIRVAYLLDSIDDPTCGTVNHVRRLTHTLDRHEFFPHVLVMTDHAEDQRLQGFTCRVERLGYQVGKPWAIVRARLRLQRYLREHRCDVVCAYDRVARMAGLPIVRSVHDGLCIGVARDMGQDLKPDDLLRLRRSNEHVHRFVASSAAVANRLMRQERVFRDWIDIIPEATLLDDGPLRTEESYVEARHSFGFSIHEPVVLVHGAFAPWTDRTMLFEALELLSEHHSNLRFVMMGYGPSDAIASVRAEAERRALDRHIVIADDPQLFDRWTLAANVGITASLYEGAADALLRFMAIGLPVVATSSGDNPEIVSHGQTGYLVPPREADALAMRIHLLLVAHDLERDFIAAARASVNNEFSDALEARRFSDYFRSLVYSQVQGFERIA